MKRFAIALACGWLIFAFDSARAGDAPKTRGQTVAADKASAADPWNDVELVVPPAGAPATGEDRVVARKPAPGVSASQPGWLRTTLSLGIVVGAILALSWVYRFVCQGRAVGQRAGPRGVIEIVGQTRLAARQNLVLVRVGTRMVLLGCANDSIRALDVIRDADVTARIAGRAQAARPEASSAHFAQCLEDESLPPPARSVSAASAIAGRLTAVLVNASAKSRATAFGAETGRNGHSA